MIRFKWIRLSFIAIVLLFGSIMDMGAQDAQPQTGGTLLYASEIEPRTLFPAATLGAGEADVWLYSCENLVELDSDGNEIPVLAESWEFSNDGKSLTFSLRQGVQFHDGTPFNAEAVKAVFDIILDQELLASSLLRDLDSIEAEDANTVTFHYSQALAATISNLAFKSMCIWSPTAFQENGADWMASHVVGTGPFIFEEWRSGEFIQFSKNPNYWQAGLPYLDGVKILIVPDPSNRIFMLQRGEIDRSSSLPVQLLQTLEDDSNFNIRSQKTTVQAYLFFNTQRAPFDDPLVRTAFGYAIDEQGIIDTIFAGGRGAGLPVAPMCTVEMVGCTDVTDEGDDTLYPYNPEKAKNLLKSAGFEDRNNDGTLEDAEGNDFNVTLWVPTERVSGSVDIGEFIQNNLKAIGIDLDIRLWEFGAMSAAVGVGPEEAEYSVVLRGWGNPTMDIDEIMQNLYHSRSWKPFGSNRMFYANDEVDRLSDFTHIETDPIKRSEIAHEALKIIASEAPVIPIVVYIHNLVERSYVHNSQILPIQNQFPARFAWLDQAEMERQGISR